MILFLLIDRRNRIKEREKDDALYAGKEKFITSAYKRKLEADRKWQDEVRRRELSRGNKGLFLTNLMNVRSEEKEVVNQPKVKSMEDTEESKEKPQEGTSVKEEEEFDGFILAPPEEQIKGNVSESESDTGLIMAPNEEKRDSHRERSRSSHRERSRSSHRERSSSHRERSSSHRERSSSHRERSSSHRERSRSSHTRHRHHRHHYHLYVFKKQKYCFGARVEKNFALSLTMVSLPSTSRYEFVREKDHVS